MAEAIAGMEVTGDRIAMYSKNPEGQIIRHSFMINPRDKIGQKTIRKWLGKGFTLTRSELEAPEVDISQIEVITVDTSETTVIDTDSDATESTEDEESKETEPNIPEGYYFCSKCNRAHNPNGSIGKKHIKFKVE